MKTFERRMAVTDIEMREESDGLTLRGYASTFNQSYPMGWYDETVDPEAFSRTLTQKPDVRLLINHDGLPLARTTSGTLTLSTDKFGLVASTRLDPTDPDVAALKPKMARGDVNQMSFGFRIVPNAKGEPGESWSSDMSKRTLTNLDLNGGDVSIVTYPANPNTSVALRAGGNAYEAIASAMRTMEFRGASDEDVRALLARMQAAYGEADPVAVQANHMTIGEALAVVVEETSDDDESQRNAALVLIRKRQLSLL